MQNEITTIWQQIFTEREERERELTFRNPWVPIFYNWVIGVLLIALTIAAIIWAADIYTSRIADNKAAAAIASYQAEQEAQELARAQELAAIQASEESIRAREATAAAKALYGVRNFIEKYGYSDRDLLTYLRCMFNRAEATGEDLETVISREGQFLGYSENNPVIDDYYKLALTAVEEWHGETTKPCDSSYQFAELTPAGIWLKADLNADGYARRWRA